MTNSRSLLERAAKAAGIELEWDSRGAFAYDRDAGGSGKARIWNPLTDDGDALRLAVKLQGHGFSMLDVAWPIIEAGKSGQDIYAAARLAIVSAAAQMVED
jgi:hypothetical protein